MISARVVVAVAAVICASACSSPSSSDSHRPTHVPPFQRTLLAGKAYPSRAAYDKGWDAFQSCVERSGGRIKIVSRDAATGIIRYATGNAIGTPDAPDEKTAEGRCYHEYFDQVEYLYETANPTVRAEQDRAAATEYREKIYPCLRAHHAKAPLTYASAGADVYRKYESLVAAGKCAS